MVVARSLVHGGRWFLISVLGIQVLVIAVCIGINAIVSDPITDTVWEWPGVVWIRYPMIGAGAGLAGAMLVPYLVHGVTRREYLRGAAAYAAGIVAVACVVGVVAYVVERGVYAIGDHDVDITSSSPLHLLVTYALLLLAYIATGALIAAAYSRWSQARASWMITPFLLPMAAAEVLLGTWWAGIARGEEDRPLQLSLAIGGPLVVAVLALSAWVVWLLLRDVAVKPKKG